MSDTAQEARPQPTQWMKTAAHEIDQNYDTSYSDEASEAHIADMIAKHAPASPSPQLANEVSKETPALRLLRSVEIDSEVAQMTDLQLADALLERIWATLDMNSAEASFVSEAIDRLCKAPQLAPQPDVKRMVERFLQWRLPENFTPDCGISFKKTFNENTPHPMTHEPTGTNLFDYGQAEEMVHYMLEGVPPTPSQPGETK
jgi:hypothetical protein